ncbi:uncharacterized protein RSE6_02942 [Rhynchosporium secalis]|uniref:Uncharacterized protein n=1 Tax=Rhynchosporium secalis TaxID=38038 RepID=A0A1E1M1H8_RHYSE|nr:uncharacterized protein RSE6_02942 [Rhynchosporium secalis]
MDLSYRFEVPIGGRKAWWYGREGLLTQFSQQFETSDGLLHDSVGIDSTSPELQSDKLHRELRSSLNNDKSSDGNEYIPPSRAYRATDQGCLLAAEAKVPASEYLESRSMCILPTNLPLRWLNLYRITDVLPRETLMPQFPQEALRIEKPSKYSTS